MDTKIADVSEETEETIGGNAPMNADNDSGSEVVDFIPAKDTLMQLKI
jgi:hypothetical protein